MAQMWGNQPVPVVQQSIDDVCLLATEGGPDLNALVDELFESLLDMMVRKVAQDDKATIQRDSAVAKIE
jgi:hypothetical protein